LPVLRRRPAGRTRGCLLRSTPETSRRLRSQIRESPDSPGRFTAGQALQAARSYVVKLATMDCERIDHNMRDILEGSTGEFKDKYGKSSAHLRQLLADNRVATHGTVVAASVKSATTNKVVVLMFIDQSVSNRNSPTPQIDRSRIKVIMDKVNGRWLASKVELL
ncbi:hypothetical protein ACNJTT_17455, partial [Mycobacterium tuberculosis]